MKTIKVKKNSEKMEPRPFEGTWSRIQLSQKSSNYMSPLGKTKSLVLQEQEETRWEMFNFIRTD